MTSTLEYRFIRFQQRSAELNIGRHSRFGRAYLLYRSVAPVPVWLYSLSPFAVFWPLEGGEDGDDADFA